MREVKEGEYYRHFEDKIYQITAVAVHAQTGEKMVVYREECEEGDVWVCPLEQFISEVDREKYPDASQKYLFERVNEPPKANPMLMRFLDAGSYRDKLELIQCWETYVDDQLLESIAVSLDIILSGKNTGDKYKQVVNCLKTLQHFETDRFR